MSKKTSKNIKTAFLLNLGFSIAEFVGGFFTNSISIISDAIHDLGDAIAIGISLFLEKKSQKAPNEEYTYGYLRYSLLGALIVSLILIAGSAIVMVNAVPRLINPVPVNYDGMLIFAVLGVIINGFAAYKTSKSKSANEKSVSLHMLEDVLGWAAVLIGSIVIKFTGLYIIDPVLSVGIAIYILLHVVKNVREIMDVFLEKSPSKFNKKVIEEKLKEIEEIKGIHHLHVWSMDGINNYATLHVLVDNEMSVIETSKVKSKIREELEEIEIQHVTVEIECECEKCNNTACTISQDERDCTHCHHHH